MGRLTPSSSKIGNRTVPCRPAPSRQQNTSVVADQAQPRFPKHQLRRSTDQIPNSVEDVVNDATQDKSSENRTKNARSAAVISTLVPASLSKASKAPIVAIGTRRVDVSLRKPDRLVGQLCTAARKLLRLLTCFFGNNKAVNLGTVADRLGVAGPGICTNPPSVPVD